MPFTARVWYFLIETHIRVHQFFLLESHKALKYQLLVQKLSYLLIWPTIGFEAMSCLHGFCTSEEKLTVLTTICSVNSKCTLSHTTQALMMYIITDFWPLSIPHAGCHCYSCQLSDQDKQAKVRILLWVMIGRAAKAEQLTTLRLPAGWQCLYHPKYLINIHITCFIPPYTTWIGCWVSIIIILI